MSESWIQDISLGVFSIVSLILIGIYYFQDNLLYFPSVPQGSKVHFLSPSEFGLQKFFSEVFITTTDKIKLQAWLFLHSKSTEHATVLFFHGNAGNISHRLPNIQDLFAKVGVNVMILSYRGYGKSEGSPNEAGLRLDAQAALDHLLSRPDIDPKSIIIFGRSLGGAVAINLCARNESSIKGLIVENTFTSVPDMIDVVFPLLRHVKFLATNKWESIQSVANISLPICFLSGSKDQLVPPSHMTKLHEAAVESARKELHLFPHGEHMDLMYQPHYYEKIAAFVNKL